ncbi:MAG: ABC transporter ATP-binding protein, partial [Clostridiaceae bacterium]
MTFPLEVCDLQFGYQGNKTNILRGANLKVKKGEIVALVGLSGCGKTTLCYCMCGIIPYVFQGDYKGKVLINGTLTSEMTLPGIATQVGIVFQDPDTQLFSPIVEDEIAFGPENLCIERNEIGKRIGDALKQVRMEKYRFGSPDILSGGQKQLIALASVLSLGTEILIFDEVMSQIDFEGKRIIKEMICELKNLGKTIVMVEHDFENLDIADRIMVMK